MSKLKEHISFITQILSDGPVSQSFQWPDEMIYFILNDVRNTLLNQKITKGKFVNPQNFQTIPCFKVENQLLVDCECYIEDCTGLISVCNIPRIISSDKGMFIEGIWTVNQSKPRRLDKITLDLYRLSKFSKTMKEVQGYFFHKDKLYITGFDRLEAVKITALFEDPLAVLNLSPTCACNPDGSPMCIDPYEVEFPMDTEANRTMRMMTYDELVKVGMLMPRDNENNAQIPGNKPALPKGRR